MDHKTEQEQRDANIADIAASLERVAEVLEWFKLEQQTRVDS